MRNRVAILAATLLSVFVPPSTAMTFAVDGQDHNILRFEGKIETNDANRMQKFLRGIKQETTKTVISLNSFGGDVAEAATMARLIHKTGYAVVVKTRNQCNSSCFLLFAASRSKQVEPSAFLGLHRVIDTKTGEDYPTGSKAMARVYAELGVPRDITGKMLATKPQDLYRLTDADLRAMHVTRKNPIEQSTPAYIDDDMHHDHFVEESKHFEDRQLPANEGSCVWLVIMIASFLLVYWLGQQRRQLAALVQHGPVTQKRRSA